MENSLKGKKNQVLKSYNIKMDEVELRLRMFLLDSSAVAKQAKVTIIASTDANWIFIFRTGWIR